MNICILGSNGMLGYGMKKSLSKVGCVSIVEVPRKDFDVLVNPIEDLVDITKECDVVVNCIGVIKPMISKFNPEDVLKINTLFPRNAAILMRKLYKKFIHITTDCVYSGQKVENASSVKNNGPYNEADIFDANDFYGLSKIGGENKECMTIRTSIIGEEPPDKAGRSLLSWAISQKGCAVNGFVNHYWNGVTTTHLANLIPYIVNNNLYSRGIYHVFTEKAVSKYDLLCIINKVYDLGLEISPVDADVPCDRRIGTHYTLNSSLPVKSLEEQIEEMRKIFGNLI